MTITRAFQGKPKEKLAEILFLRVGDSLNLRFLGLSKLNSFRFCIRRFLSIRGEIDDFLISQETEKRTIKITRLPYETE